MSTSHAAWEPAAERRELAAALRRLVDTAVLTSASPADLRAAAVAADDLTARLSGPAVSVDDSVRAGSYREQMSLVGGASHPIAPQLRMVRVDSESALGEVVIGPVFQGGPGLVHGGILALLIDHAMGCVAAQPDRPAMTAQLTMRYRRPTPLGVPLAVSVRLDRAEGRKLLLSAAITAHGVVTVEADGVFLVLTQENLATVFRRD
jgi:acyl-coenzyme A thioesterase PaaI-like protein